MSAPPAMTMPGGRVVLGWWRDLAGLEPRRLWYAHLVLHQVEALVEASVPAPPLAALADALRSHLADHPGPVPPPRLAGDLALDARLLAEVLADLQTRGLAWPDADGWRLTEAGRQPMTRTASAERRLQRRSFCFSASQPPLFVPLAATAPQLLAAAPALRFDLAVLEACVRESEAWKVRHGFPLDVLRVVRAGDSPDDWRAVAVDLPAQALLALVEVAARTGTVLLGFPVRPDGWALAREPALNWPDGAEQLAPLGAEPGVEVWRHAWQMWCQQRSLPGGDVEACRLEVVGHRLRVQAPARLVERLRTARSDALKGEAWLLAGTGRVRPAAMIELVEG
jgi:hypothetical protein